MNAADASRPVADSSALGALIDELTERMQAGEAVDLEAILRDHPGQAEELRRLLPALQLLADVGASAPAARRDDSEDDGQQPGRLGDFHLLREVGRGGMGVVYEAEQISLSRRVALKVLPFAGAMDPRQLQRFRHEAQAAAMLHHPNVVPVYGVGCERGVHYYAMQLIDGQSLAAVIEDLRGDGRAGSRERPEEDPSPPTGPNLGARTQPRSPATVPVAALTTQKSRPGKAHFRRAAELMAQAADALEYAHSMGVVHRDVKPANLLLDSASHLWVTDFGLARLGDGAGLTVSGDLLGTLRYMSPEQALAQHGLVDHRTDVYSLGATLYELLTLQPAVGGESKQEVLKHIAFEEPVRPRKLDKAIPVELETVTLNALAKNPAERYASAGELADDLRRWLQDQSIRAKRPSLTQRARRWARRHRPVVGAAAAVLLLAVLAAGGFGWWQARQWAETERHVELALQEAAIFHGEAKWPDALAAVKRADALLASGAGSGAMRRRTRELRQDLDMAAELEDIRLRFSAIRSDHGRPDYEADNDAPYQKAFRAYGIDLLVLDPRRAAQLIQTRTIRAELVAALDDWARLLARSKTKKDSWRRLLEVARLADADDWRNQVRRAVEAGDAGTLKAIARADHGKSWSPSILGLLAEALHQTGAKAESVDLLQEAQRRYPGDFWINTDLAGLIRQTSPSEKGEVVRFLTAALAVRPQDPDAYIGLGYYLMRQGSPDEAVALFREAVRLRPNDGHTHNVLGQGLSRKGSHDEAAAECREAIRLDPKHSAHYSNLGFVLVEKGLLDEAVAACQEAIRLRPDNEHAHNHLGLALRAKGQLDEAVASYGEAIRLKKDFAWAHNNRGIVFAIKGQLDEAIACFREASRLDKNDPLCHTNLGNVLCHKGRLDEAIASHREAIRLKTDFASAHSNLGEALLAKGRLDEAIASCREAVRLKTDFADAHTNLGAVLQAKGQLDEAIASYREAMRLKTDGAEAHNNLAWLRATSPDPKFRDTAQAIALAKKAVELKPSEGAFRNTLGVALYRAGDWNAAVSALEKSMELHQGGDSCDWFFLAMAHWQMDQKPAAHKWYDRAVQWMDKNKPQDAELRRFRAEAAALLQVKSGDTDKK